MVRVGSWVKVRTSDGLWKIFEVSEVGEYYIGLTNGGYTFRKYIIEER